MNTLKFTARRIGDAAKSGTACAVLPIFQGEKLSDAAQQLDAATGGSIKAALALGDFSGKSDQTTFLPGAAGIKRLLLVGCGKASLFDRDSVRKFLRSMTSALKACQAGDATVYAASLATPDGDNRWLLQQLAGTLTTAAYRYTETVSRPKPAMTLRKVTVVADGDLSARAQQQALEQGQATGTGINTARRLADLPANICTPTYLLQQARKMARTYAGLSVSVLDEKKMRELDMGALLSVSAGSVQPAKLIVMKYSGGKKGEKPYALVGKGVTFDSGGISLKPGAKMDEMKYDMGGAASVFGTITAIADMALPLNAIGIVAATENMPSGGATKPGDVVTSMAGKTIEVLNTDAEGRLVLCDALTYAGRFKPQAVIDIATLTGACVVALGAHASGLYANQDELADELLAAGIDSHDRAWRMPLWDEYSKQLDTPFADMGNIGGAGGGSVTAACFLARFTENYRWAHLDIAGSAWSSTPKGSTGRPVALLTRYLMDRAGL